MSPAEPERCWSDPQSRKILRRSDHVSTQVKLVNLPEDYDVDVIHVIVPNLKRQGCTEHLQGLLPIPAKEWVHPRSHTAAGSIGPTDTARHQCGAYVLSFHCPPTYCESLSGVHAHPHVETCLTAVCTTAAREPGLSHQRVTGRP